MAAHSSRRPLDPLESPAAAQQYLNYLWWKVPEREPLLRAAQYGAQLGRLWEDDLVVRAEHKDLAGRLGVRARAAQEKGALKVLPPAEYHYGKVRRLPGAHGPDGEGLRDEVMATPSLEHAPPFDEVEGWVRYILGEMCPRDLQSARWPYFDKQCTGALWDRAIAVYAIAAKLPSAPVMPRTPARAPQEPNFAVPPVRPDVGAPEPETRLLGQLGDLVEHLEHDDALPRKVTTLRSLVVMASAAARTASALGLRRPTPQEIAAFSVVQGLVPEDVKLKRPAAGPRTAAGAARATERFDTYAKRLKKRLGRLEEKGLGPVGLAPPPRRRKGTTGARKRR